MPLRTRLRGVIMAVMGAWCMGTMGVWWSSSASASVCREEDCSGSEGGGLGRAFSRSTSELGGLSSVGVSVRAF